MKMTRATLETLQKYKYDRRIMSAAIPHLSSMSAFNYAKYIVGRRVPEIEDTIAEDPNLAWRYYGDVMEYQGEWKAAEPVFAEDPAQALHYAAATQKPFPEGEAAIKRDAEACMGYAKWILKRPWPEGETAIREGWRTGKFAQHGCWVAFEYIMEVLVPAGETDFTRFYKVMQSNPPTWEKFKIMMIEEGEEP